jgi:thiamine-phosphate pyrophosphorylase
MPKTEAGVPNPEPSRTPDDRESRIPNPEYRRARIPNPQSRIPPRLPRLMPIVDVDAASQAGWPPVDIARAYLKGGAALLQIRAKTSSSSGFLEAARAIVGIAHDHGAMAVINDRADIALLAGADGVHVGQDDLSPEDVRRIVGVDAIVGLSTHTVDQLDAALRQPISYAAIGPVFGTTTKRTDSAAIGLEAVCAAANRAAESGVPLVAIGGITLETAASVIAAGATSVAVISDLLVTGDPAARTRDFVERLSRSTRAER